MFRIAVWAGKSGAEPQKWLIGSGGGNTESPDAAARIPAIHTAVLDKRESVTGTEHPSRCRKRYKYERDTRIGCQ